MRCLQEQQLSGYPRVDVIHTIQSINTTPWKPNQRPLGTAALPELSSKVRPSTWKISPSEFIIVSSFLNEWNLEGKARKNTKALFSHCFEILAH